MASTVSQYSKMMPSTSSLLVFSDLTIGNNFLILNPIYRNFRSLAQGGKPKLQAKTLVPVSPVQNPNQSTMASTMSQYRMISMNSIFSYYATFSTTLMMVKSAYREIMPKKLENYIVSEMSRYLAHFLPPPPSSFIIDDSWEGFNHNVLIEAATIYLSNKIGAKNKTVRVGKFKLQDEMTVGLVHGEEMVDEFDGIEVTWAYSNIPDKDGRESYRPRDNYFQLTFPAEHRDKVLNEYLVHVMEKYKALNEEETVLQLYTNSGASGSWTGVDFRHPSTFDTLAMDYDLKKAIMDDLDRFLSRQEFYKKIGRTWKRGYLLYGPPGTGKSSLIAAMANYLKFDVYNLVLENIDSDSDLRDALVYTDGKAIIVVEDIDCNAEVLDRSRSNSEDRTSKKGKSKSKKEKQFTLSTLLNGMDGLWSICHEERIFVFTTNHKEVLDPALLRPGRMDMHIHMSYCTPESFRVLASNYIGVKDHPLFEEIEALIKSVDASPASIAEELMKSDVADVALGEVVKFLKQKKMGKVKTEMKKEKKAIEKETNEEENQQKKLETEKMRNLRRKSNK